MVEYVIVIGIVMIVIFAMSIIIKQQTQALVKGVADQIGHQEDAEQNFYDETSSHMDESSLDVFGRMDKTRVEQPGGIISYVYDDATRSESYVLLNQGLTYDNP